MSRNVNITRSLIMGIHQQLSTYKNKFYKNQLIKGAIISLALILSVFLAISFIEFVGRLNSVFRAVLLLTFVGTLVYTLVFLLGKPIAYFLGFKKSLTDEQAAKDIGKFFPQISDKLLNTLQLVKEGKEHPDNALLMASIAQKSDSFKFIRFADAIHIGENKKYLKYVLPPLALVLFISAIAPSFFKSSERILKFQKEFVEEAPFQFLVQNKSLTAVKNEDFTLKVAVEGSALPEDVFLEYNDRKFKMTLEDKYYTYTFSRIQNPVDFNFFAAGFNSDSYNIDLVNKPELLSFNVFVSYPSYLGKEAEELNNAGNIIVPEGTIIDWRFKTIHTDSLFVRFGENAQQVVEKSLINGFSLRKKLSQSVDYKFSMKNKELINQEDVSYFINVVKDQYPKLLLEEIKDTVNYNYIVLGGSISDDYGLSLFKLNYRTTPEEPFREIPIAISKNQTSQSFYYQFNLAPLNLKKEDNLEYFLEVWDNDGVNGAKSTKSQAFTFKLPDNAAFDLEVEKQVKKTEDKMLDLVQKSEKLQKDMEDLDKTLKSKKELDFNDKKKLEDILKQKENLQKELRDLQKELNKLQEKQNRFDQQSPELQQKMDQLQELLQELMQNEDIQKEMEKLMEENELNKIQERVEDLKNKDRNLNRELDRTLKLFKNLQLKEIMDKASKDLKDLAEKQDELAEQAEKAEDTKELAKEQKEIQEEFDRLKEKLKEAEKLSKELKKNIDTQKSEQQKASDEMKDAQQKLEQQQGSPASKSQKKASKTMRNMANALSSAMQSAEMQQLEMDIDALRDILENLVKISFDQEKIMQDFRKVSSGDPRFVELSQRQLKIVDDAKTIEDSLYSLASRVMQIEAFVTKEVTKMKNSMDKSLIQIKAREFQQANAQQQFSMTSINNLALLLSDTFQQMQQMMASAMPGSGKSGKQGQTPSPGLGEQMGEINKKLQGVGSSGSNGNTNEQLAKLASQQAKLRKQIQQMLDKLNGTEQGEKLGNDLREIEKALDKNEESIVNKKITPDLIKRQKNLETRLLEVDKALKEQELDPKRKSNTAVNFERNSPPGLEEFLKAKEKQLELIRTTPPNFTPFYKTETDNYFQRIK